MLQCIVLAQTICRISYHNSTFHSQVSVIAELWKAINIDLDVELQITASHFTRDKLLDDFNGNQHAALKPWTGDMMSLSFSNLHCQIPTNINKLIIQFSHRCLVSLYFLFHKKLNEINFKYIYCMYKYTVFKN